MRSRGRVVDDPRPTSVGGHLPTTPRLCTALARLRSCAPVAAGSYFSPLTLADGGVLSVLPTVRPLSRAVGKFLRWYLATTVGAELVDPQRASEAVTAHITYVHTQEGQHRGRRRRNQGS